MEPKMTVSDSELEILEVLWSADKALNASEIRSILNEHKKSLNGAKVLVLGVAYKQDIDDYRESPALEVIDILKEKKAEVDYYDPFISVYRHNGMQSKGLDELTAEIVTSYDLIMIATAHTKVDYQMISQNARVIFDTKNAMKHIGKRENIEVL